MTVTERVFLNEDKKVRKMMRNLAVRTSYKYYGNKFFCSLLCIVADMARAKNAPSRGGKEWKGSINWRIK